MTRSSDLQICHIVVLSGYQIIRFSDSPNSQNGSHLKSFSNNLEIILNHLETIQIQLEII